MTWLAARRKMVLIHAIDVPKLDEELSAQIDKVVFNFNPYFFFQQHVRERLNLARHFCSRKVSKIGK
jgi:hypothetical protein